MNHQEHQINFRNQCIVFAILSVFLAIMAKYPMRIILNEICFDISFYGLIVGYCLVMLRRIFIHMQRGKRILTVIVLLCLLLSGWQVFDLAIMHFGGPSVVGFGALMDPRFEDTDGLAWYHPLIRNNTDRCAALYEQYIGNMFIAVTVRIERDAIWFACRG